MARGGSNSAGYIFISSLSSKFILIVGGIILARILPVEDFGYLLTLNIIFGFISLFSISGYEFYFIQNRDYKGNDEMILLRQVFNLRFIQSTILFFITNCIALYQYYYGDMVLGILLAVTSLLFLIQLISKPEETLLSKKLEYKTLSISAILRDIISSITKVLCAIIGLGAISFGVGNVIGTFFYSIFIKKKHNLHLFKKVGFRQAIEPYTKIRKFGFHLFLNTAGGFLTKQVDKIFIATYFDKSEQGFYQFSNTYAAYPFNTLITPQNNMVLSLMSKHRDQPNYLIALFNKFGVVSGLTIFPFFIFIFMSSPEIFEALVGAKWLEAVPLFRIFLIYYFIKIMFYPSNGILTSFGRPDIKARVTISTFIVSIPLLLYISVNNYDIVFYGLVFIILSILSDLVCTVIGLHLMKESLYNFLVVRVKYLFPSAVLALLFLIIDTFFQLHALPKTMIALTITLLVIYFSLIVYSRVFMESFEIFIKNKRINSLMKKFIWYKK
jgi:O-antigen/teichoic acid export membrane protein